MQKKIMTKTKTSNIKPTGINFSIDIQIFISRYYVEKNIKNYHFPWIPSILWNAYLVFFKLYRLSRFQLKKQLSQTLQSGFCSDLMPWMKLLFKFARFLYVMLLKIHLSLNGGKFSLRRFLIISLTAFLYDCTDSRILKHNQRSWLYDLLVLWYALNFRPFGYLFLLFLYLINFFSCSFSFVEWWVKFEFCFPFDV